MTRIIHGENLTELHALDRQGVIIDLAYLDPPFCTGRVFEMGDRVAYDDRWQSRSNWLAELAKRLVVIHRMLAPHGCVVVHVDPKTSHLVKGFCDALFGDDAFASEIVWRYRRWPSKTPNFQRVHDVLLRYRKDPKVPPRWNQLYEPLAASTVATWGTKKQRAIVVDGERKRSSSTEEESMGVRMGDVWDIGMIAPVSAERTGYPTQKPEALLERIVGALSLPGDIIVDPYMGSGTTLVVAARMGRRAIGIDQSLVAVEVATTRIKDLRRDRNVERQCTRGEVMGCKCATKGCVICDNRKKRKRAVREAKAAGRTVPYDMRTLIEDGHSPATIRAVWRSPREAERLAAAFARAVSESNSVDERSK